MKLLRLIRREPVAVIFSAIYTGIITRVAMVVPIVYNIPPQPPYTPDEFAPRLMLWIFLMAPFALSWKVATSFLSLER